MQVQEILTYLRDRNLAIRHTPMSVDDSEEFPRWYSCLSTNPVTSTAGAISDTRLLPTI